MPSVSTIRVRAASRTSLLNLETGQWDSDLCDLFGVPIDALPEIRPTMGDFGAVNVIDAISEQLSIGNDISIDGGMSVNPYFCQFLCDVLQKRVVVQSMSELTALGTATMAMGNENFGDVAIGEFRSYEPAASHIDGKARFAEAVSYSRNWR